MLFRSLISFVAAPTAPLVWAMYADSADYSEWKFGRRATGLVFSAASFAQKLGWAVGGAGTGWLLAFFGYVPNLAQSPETIDGLKLMMSFIPAAGALLAIAALWFYPLDEATVERMSRELEERRAREPGHTPRSLLSMPLLQADPFGAAASHRLMETIMTQTPNDPEATTARSASAPQQPAFAPGGSADGRPGAAKPPPLSRVARATLDEQFRATLRAGVHGLCFSPYLEGQSPGAQVSEAQIRERLAIIRPHTRWIRTFSCTDGHEQTPRVAHELGMKTMVGAWLGTDLGVNEREIEGVIAVAKAGHADLVAVGNEVMLREDMSEDALLAYIERVKQALPGVPVGYVDAYFLFEKHPRITAACDVVMTNCYPFWEGCPREQALAYMQTMVQRTRTAAPGKRIVISETGWPDQGSPFHAAVPCVEGAMQYFVDTMAWAQQDGIEVFYFAAFDEAWKVGAEGDVGAYWGLWDKDARPKFG